jgi:type IV pilus assembly protein PilO
MNLSLAKLPWYGQVGAFVALAAAALGVFFFFYVSPANLELAERQKKLDTLRMEANLKIDEFKPATTPNNKLLHAEWPIELQLEGNYHNLALFFDRIGKFARIININSLEIKARDKQDPALTITAQCTATTFVLLDAKTAAAQQAAADKAAKKAPGS